MKQCPDPNCILYTRLEELPDAYVRCPGCGGLLVEANMQSGMLRSGPLSLTPGLASRDLDEEFEAAFPGGLPSSGVDGTMDPMARPAPEVMKKASIPPTTSPSNTP